MSYREYTPHIALQPYIDAYWTMENKGNTPVSARILPDGCVDIIINLGDDYITETGGFVMQHERACLVGTMTTYKQGVAMPGAILAGIRFRPGTFSLFFGFDVLHEVTDIAVELERKMTPTVYTLDGLKEKLDSFLLPKIPAQPSLLLPLIADMQNSRGQVSVTALQQKYFITARKLERSFRQHVGISPKAFLNFVRCRAAYDALKTNKGTRNIAAVAYEYGYYDHAHLLKDIKKFAGSTPSQL
jgi:AraC-like DNA-binding protein